MTSFTAAVAVDQDAFERFAGAPLPTTEEEIWRYSRINDLDLDEYAPVTEAPAEGAADLPPGLRSGFAVVVDGRLVAAELEPELEAKGVRLGVLDDRGALNGTRGQRVDAIDHLHDAYAVEPIVLDVPAGVAVPAPVIVVHRVEREGAAVFPHLLVRAGADSSVTVYDHQSSADVRALVVPQVELDVADAARVRYVQGQELGHQVWQLGRQSSRVGQDATFATHLVGLGGHYARTVVESSMEGRGGSGEMQAVYFGEGSQMHDFRTVQDHVAPNTTSNLLFKGAVQGRSRAVYTGLIHIGKQASGVTAFQTNRNVKLSESAWAESVPNLEIENNDVRCSHASAVGPVDEEQLFYLESRGIPPHVAEQLIVLGFLDEVIDRLPVVGAAAGLRAEIVAKLGRREVDS
jgi:Fe-S cluster assembly protein SufD